MFKNLFKKPEANLGYGGNMSPEVWQRLWGEEIPSMNHSKVTQHSSIMIPAVYRAVDVIASSIASLPIHIKQAGERLTNDPAYFLLHYRPNVLMGKFVFMQTIVSHVLLWGNAYIEVEYTGGIVTSLRLIHPSKVVATKRINEDAIDYTVTVNGESYVLPQDRVIHLRNMGHDGILGLSNIALHRKSLQLTEKMESYGDEFFSTAASSGGVLTHPQTISDTARKNLQTSLNDRKKNPRNVLLLEEGMKLERNSIPPEDMQFLDSRVYQVTEVCRMFGVPPVLLFEHSKNTSWGSGIEETVLGFVKFKLQPLIVHIEEEFGYKLLTREQLLDGVQVKMSLGGLLRGDSKSRAEYYTKMHNISAINANEVRGFEDLQAYDGGDNFKTPLNMATVGEEQDVE